MATLSRALVAVAAAGAILYFARLALIPVFIAILFAVTLAPAVQLLMRARVPRALAAIVVVVLVFSALTMFGYLGYRRAAAAVTELPKHEAELRQLVRSLHSKQSTVQRVLGAEAQPASIPPVTSLLPALATGGELLLAASFVPFLCYFMLSWAPHARRATARLFAHEAESRASLDEIAHVLRRFIIANALVALVMGVVSAGVFALVLHMPDAISVGLLSGALNIVPYLGVVIAPIIPLLADVNQLDSGQLLGILATCWGLHLVALNFVYPKMMGGRMQLNPLMATVAMLVWTCLWGAIGLVLAIPLTAALKIACDRVPRLRSIGAWLGT